MTRNVKLLVAVPTTGSIHTELVKWLLGVSAQKEIPVEFLLVFPPMIPHDSARNLILKRFRESDCTHLLQIDADVVPSENIFLLLEHDVDLVAGLYHIWNGAEVVPIAARKRAPDIPGGPVGIAFSKEPDPTLVPVDYFGGGCVLMTRKVAEAFHRAKEIPYKFEYDDDGIMWRGEDYYFTDKAKALGFQPYVDPRVRCSHYKSLDLLFVNRLLHSYYKAVNSLTSEKHGDGNLHGSAAPGENPSPPRRAKG